MKEQLIALAAQALPGIIATLKAEFIKANPNLPEPTNDDVLQALTVSATKDADWLAAHPETPDARD